MLDGGMTGMVGFPMSDLRPPTSDFRLPTSDFRLPTSDFLSAHIGHRLGDPAKMDLAVAAVRKGAGLFEGVHNGIQPVLRDDEAAKLTHGADCFQG